MVWRKSSWMKSIESIHGTELISKLYDSWWRPFLSWWRMFTSSRAQIMSVLIRICCGIMITVCSWVFEVYWNDSSKWWKYVSQFSFSHIRGNIRDFDVLPFFKGRFRSMNSRRILFRWSYWSFDPSDSIALNDIVKISINTFNGWKSKQSRIDWHNNRLFRVFVTIVEVYILLIKNATYQSNNAVQGTYFIARPSTTLKFMFSIAFMASSFLS